MEAEQLVAKIKTDNEILRTRIKEWLIWDRNADTFSEVRDLLLQDDYNELAIRLEKRMEFGTAGLRSALGAGFARMNDLTVIQTSQGLCKYLLEKFPEIKSQGVVIGHDARYGSHRFARLCAAVFISQNIKVLLFSEIVPTPFVPFSVVKYGCCAGVMVTASHNPKEDNGYKVYYSNGAQIIPPHDKGISDSIMKNLVPWDASWDAETVKKSQLCTDPLAEVMQSYYSEIQKHCNFREINRESQLKITYTAMHGVGNRYAEESFKAFSLHPFITVKEQAAPDPDFPTVKFPNPEEGKSSLNLSIKTANENGSTFIVANDPDADRLAIAEKQANGSWKIFTGNEMGCLLGWWAFFNHKNSNPHNYPGKNVYMLHSAVSSAVLESIAAVEGFCTSETLTGFKWLANKSIDLMKEDKTVLFAFEEAIGFMYGPQVLDKDGICAAAVMGELASYLYNQNMTVTGQLDALYQRYGVHVSNNSYYICHSKPTIEKIFKRIKTLENGTYPSKIGGINVKSVRDLSGQGFDSNQPDKKPVLPTSSSSEMITFVFENGVKATIRTSGTEPKIKYYTEIASKPGQSIEKSAVKGTLDAVVASLINELLEPEKNGLIPRAE